MAGSAGQTVSEGGRHTRPAAAAAATSGTTYLLGAEVEGHVLLASKVGLERVTLTLADKRVDAGNGLADRRAVRREGK